jgi:hypothetical protein
MDFFFGLMLKDKDPFKVMMATHLTLSWLEEPGPRLYRAKLPDVIRTCECIYIENSNLIFNELPISPQSFDLINFILNIIHVDGMILSPHPSSLLSAVV